MRIALAVLVVGSACARQAAPVELAGRAADADAACDLAAWQHRATSRLRAQIAGREIIVVADRGRWAQVVARIGEAVLVGTTVPTERFDLVVVHETPVARVAGGPALPGVLAEPGLAGSGSGEWPAVHSDAPIEVAGFVQRAATGRVWEAATPAADPSQSDDPRRQSLEIHTELLAAPAFGAERVASISGGYAIVDRIEQGPAGWRHVEAHTDRVRVAGWVAAYHPGPLHNSYDFSGATIEGELIHPEGVPRRWHAVPGCLRARPDDRAPVLGIVTDEIAGRQLADGWLEVRVDAPWGEVIGYVRADVSTEPPWI